MKRKRFWAYKSIDELKTTACRSVARKWEVPAKTLHAFDNTQSFNDNRICIEVKGGNWNYTVEMTKGGRVTFNERERI